MSKKLLTILVSLAMVVALVAVPVGASAIPISVMTPPTAAQTPPGSTWIGWALSPNGEVLDPSTKADNTVVYFPVFRMSVYTSVNSVVATFTTTLTYPTDALVDSLPKPADSEAPSGFTGFKGWALTEGGAVLAGNTTLVGNQTYYALWTPEEVVEPTMWTVTFDGGNPIEVADGDAIGQLPEPAAREGYTFTGWKDAQDNVVTSTTVVTSDLDLVSQWIENKSPEETTTPKPPVVNPTKPTPPSLGLTKLGDTADATALPTMGVMALLMAASAALMVARRRREA